MLQTTLARATHHSERNGTCDLFAALKIATGKVMTDIRNQHTPAEFVAFLNKVDRNVPNDLDVTMSRIVLKFDDGPICC
jgi:hypothetical protein